MTKFDLIDSTKSLAIKVINSTEILPNKQQYWIISKQIIRSATSVGANYRSVCVARSGLDFISKLGIVIEETDETLYWLDILNSMFPSEAFTKLILDYHELLKIFISSRKTALNNKNGK